MENISNVLLFYLTKQLAFKTAVWSVVKTNNGI